MALTPEKQATDKVSPRNTDFSLGNAKGYNINNLSYPTGVSSEPDLLHYVSFFFNMRGKSSIFADKPPGDNLAMGVVEGEVRADPSKLGRPIILGGVAMGVTATLGLGRIVGNYVMEKSMAAGMTAKMAGQKALIAQVGVGAAAGALGGIAAAIAVKPDTTYRISDVITLHLPHAPKVSYNVSYAEVELGTLAGMISGGSSAADTTRSAMVAESIGALVLAGSAAGANNAAAMLSKKIGMNAPITGEQVMSAARIAEGASLNPFREVLFKGVAMRRHSFNYTFMPKSKEESDNIHNILKVFRYHAMPELSTGSLYMIHPSEVVAQIYFNGKENLNFPKMATSVIETVDITYGGDKFSSFRDGSPVEIHLTLVLREISTVTKKSVQEGY